MKPVLNFEYFTSSEQAIALQLKLAKQVIAMDSDLDQVRYVAGIDVAYSTETDELIAAIIILDAETYHCVEKVIIKDRVEFPYIPGLFAFREIPPLLKAFECLEHCPDLLICDGHGIAHPRRLGLASHLGLLYNIPSIGCAKNIFIGHYDATFDLKRGNSSPIYDQNEIIGVALCTQTGIKPVFVSLGHKISLETSITWILRLSPHYRQPETTRQADQLVRKTLKQLQT